MNTLLIIVVILIAFLGILGLKRGLFPASLIRLPFISGINRILGLLMGIIEAFLLVWIFFTIVYYNQEADFAIRVMPLIEESPLLSWLYHHNFILLFISLFF